MSTTYKEQIHKILMDFRNAVQADRDRLYKTRVVTTDHIKVAHDQAEAAIDALNAAVIGEYEEPELIRLHVRNVGNPAGQRDAFRTDLRHRFGIGEGAE